MAIRTQILSVIDSPLAAARGVAPQAAAYAEQTERERALPAELLSELLDAGLLGLCLPEALGGREAEPAEMVRAIAELARADAATAWCAMIASTSSLLGAYLPEADARLIYASGRAVTGGVFAPRGRATRQDDGYLVSGRWSFVSGVGHCDWVMGGCVVDDGERPEPLPSGAPDVRLMLMPIDSVEIIDTWSVSGLRGTGSHDIVVADVFVPAARGISLLSDRPRHPGALYSFPLFGLLALGIAAVALGIARGAIEDLIALAAGKKPAAGAKTLAQRAAVQAEVASAEASLRAARGLMLEEAELAWAAALDGEEISDEHRMGLRLAATHATGAAAEIVTAMYHAAGGSSIYDSSSLQRRFRDVHVATQHMMVAPSTLELTGRLLLGLPTDTSQL
jgi:indole-3-acetate monooxygenase